MAIACIRSFFSQEQHKWVKDYVLDSSSDLANLPTTGIAAGSLAHFADNDALVAYEFAPAGSWVQIAGESQGNNNKSVKSLNLDLGREMVDSLSRGEETEEEPEEEPEEE